MAAQGTLASSEAEVAEFEAAESVGLDDFGVEVDEVGVVGGRALGAGDAVGVVAGGAGGFEVYDVFAVGFEGFIREDAGAGVALVA